MVPSENLNTIQDLEAEIDRTKTAIQNLSDLQISLSYQRNSKLPIFNLPSGTCISIFSLACHNGPLIRDWNQRVVMTPFIISSVCHAWRVIAHSAPELWSSVSLCLRNSSRKSSMIQAELLDRWLYLSKALPLSISITFKGYGSDVFTDTPESPNPIISVAASYSHQWESVDLVLPSSFFDTLQHIIGPIPNLESLSLNLTLSADTSTSTRAAWALLSPRMFPDAPKLRTVDLDCAKVHVKLPYRRLEELTLREYNTTSCLDLLAKCPNLTCLKMLEHRSAFGALSSWTAQNMSFRHSKTVHLSKLVSLEITHSDPSILNYIVAPALQSITISLLGAPQIESFSTFLVRSNVVLQRLSIIDSMPAEEELLKMLDTLPHLSHLEVNLRPMCLRRGMLLSQKFLDYLRIPNGKSVDSPLPALASFKYQGPTNFQFRDSHDDEENSNRADLEILEKMLLSRWNSFNGVSQLQSFSMSNIQPPLAMLYNMPTVQPTSGRIEDIEQSHVVRGLRKEGMHLVFMLEEPRKGNQ